MTTEKSNESEKEKKSEKGNVNVENERKSRLEKIKANLAKLKEMKKEQSTGFMKINAGETKILEFTGDMEAVERTFKRKDKDGNVIEESKPKQMYAYKVIDLEDKEAGIQTWEVSRQWSDDIDNQLSEGWLTLKIKRTGTSLGDTDYKFTPVNPSSSSGAPAS